MHQIFQDRRMFFSGETPWHGLGQRLPSNAGWAQVAHMFPRVDERPIAMLGGGLIPDQKCLISSDDGRYLATVGADYCVVQAETIARAIMEAAASTGAIFHTGGLLGARGARGWLMGELPAAAFTAPGDTSQVKAYFSAVWGHDGRTPVRLLNNATRIVCANTVAAALGESGGFKVSVRHTSGAADAVIDAGRQFARLHSSMARLEDFAHRAAETRVGRDTVEAALDALFPRGADESPAQADRREAAQVQVIQILKGPTVAPALRGTAWGLLQAMTEFEEHFACRLTEASKQVDAIAARQIEGSMMGDLARIYSVVGDLAGVALPG